MSRDCSLWNRRTWRRVQTYKSPNAQLMSSQWYHILALRVTRTENILFDTCSSEDALIGTPAQLTYKCSQTWSRWPSVISCAQLLTQSHIEPDLWRSSLENHSARKQILCFRHTLKTHLYAFSWYNKVLYILVMVLWLMCLKVQYDCAIMKMQQERSLLDRDYKLPSINFISSFFISVKVVGPSIHKRKHSSHSLGLSVSRPHWGSPGL